VLSGEGAVGGGGGALPGGQCGALPGGAGGEAAAWVDEVEDAGADALGGVEQAADGVNVQRR
jgi:hypothetical protein